LFYTIFCRTAAGSRRLPNFIKSLQSSCGRLQTAGVLNWILTQCNVV